MDGSKYKKQQGWIIMSDKSVSYIKCIMLGINAIAIIFLAYFILSTTQKICDYNIAREFLDRISAIPNNPKMVTVLSVLLLISLIISFIIREFLYPNKSIVIYSSLAIDFLVSVMLMSVLNFNYNGILFWVFANIIYYVHDKMKFISVFLAIVIYVGTDHELLSIKYHLFSLNDYVGYYNASTQQYILGGYNLLISLNIIMFIVFCILVIQRQQGIIEKVNSLYQKLSKTNNELQDANVELQKYAIMKEKMGETKERNRLAREIHDTLGHTLTGISAGIDACIATVDCSPGTTKQQLEVISKVTRDGISEIRRSVNELRPDALERLSLESAIENMINDITSVSKVVVSFDSKVKNLKFDEDEENTIYRIIQESITNSIRHGKATKVWVTMEKEDLDMHIRIKDNGIGCYEMKKGFGSKHMIERVQMLHGTVFFDGTEGFLVDALIPIRWGEEYD